MGGSRRLRGWQRGLIAFVLYLIVAVAVWASPILTRFNERYLGDGYWDAKFYQWSVGWMHWSIANHADPLYTHKLFPPNGTSLAWSAFDPAGGLAMYPVRALFGSLVATNTLLVLGSALACWGAYLVCHRVTGAFWPSLVGGYLFGSETKSELIALERTTPIYEGCASTHIVCRVGCSSGRRMRPDNRIVFASVQDARSVGYRPCKVCKPSRAA